MRFAHISDTHLGFRQYGIPEREEDFYRAFEEAVKRIIEERPDFVIHSGDLFDFHRPQPRAIWVAQRCFSRLNEKGIPVFAITGNHDMLMRRGSMPPQALFLNNGVRLITEEEPFFMHKGIFIGGCPYTSKYYSARLTETLGILSKKARGSRRSILVLHQGIEKFLPHEFELTLDDIPKTFDYYALGHVHARIVHNFGNGVMAYPGSGELWSVSEYDDYRKKGKGFFLVDLDGDKPSVQPVDIGLNRDIIKERIHAQSLQKELDRLKSEMTGLGGKPLVYIDIEGGDLDRKGLHETIHSQLSELSLSLRVSYLTAAEKQAAKTLSRSFNIPEMIRESAKDKGRASLALMLFSSLSQGDEERAIKEARDFFENEMAAIPAEEKTAGSESNGDDGT